MIPAVAPDQAPVVINELKSLIPALAPAELEQLESSIKSFGQRSPILIGKIAGQPPFVVDGHNRLEICNKLGLAPIYSKPIDFDSYGDAHIWLIDNQLARRNLCDLDRGLLVLKRKAIVQQESAKRTNQHAVAGEIFPSAQKGKTWDLLAKGTGISGKTLEKIGYLSEKVQPELLQEIRDGKTSISKVHAAAKNVGVVRKKKEATPVSDILDNIEKHVKALMDSFHEDNPTDIASRLKNILLNLSGYADSFRSDLPSFRSTES